MHSLSYLKSRRLWIVPEVLVCGLPSDASFYYLGAENVDSSERLMFGQSSVGNAAQGILFADLVDHRGNKLPSTISSPRILVRPRSPYNAYLVGEESGSGFQIVRDPAAPGPVSVDLFIYETGI